MIVPITSDLQGYATFWSGWLELAGAAGTGLAVIVVSLLLLIWREVRAIRIRRT